MWLPYAPVHASNIHQSWNVIDMLHRPVIKCTVHSTADAPCRHRRYELNAWDTFVSLMLQYLQLVVLHCSRTAAAAAAAAAAVVADLAVAAAVLVHTVMWHTPAAAHCGWQTGHILAADCVADCVVGTVGHAEARVGLEHICYVIVAVAVACVMVVAVVVAVDVVEQLCLKVLTRHRPAMYMHTDGRYKTISLRYVLCASNASKWARMWGCVSSAHLTVTRTTYQPHQ